MLDKIKIVFYLLMKRKKEPSAEEKENILVVLTNDGYLKVMSADTGFVLRSIFLSTIIKFRSVYAYICTVLMCTHIYVYRKQGNICWATLSCFLRFSRVPKRFFCRYYTSLV